MNIPIPLNDMQDKIIWKYTADGNFSIKTATWANNDKIASHLRPKLLNYICKLKLLSKIKIFAWKLVRGKILTRSYLNNIGIDIDSSCPFCHIHTEDIDHLFKGCEFV